MKELRCKKCNKMLGIFTDDKDTEVYRNYHKTNMLEMKCPRCSTKTEFKL